MGLNEIVIVTQNGDDIEDLIKTGLEIVKLQSVSYVIFNFNGCRISILKSSTKESILEEYVNKLRNL